MPTRASRGGKRADPIRNALGVMEKSAGGKVVQFLIFEDTAPIIAALQGSRRLGSQQ
jgi:hypothetical protein